MFQSLILNKVSACIIHSFIRIHGPFWPRKEPMILHC